MSDYPSTSPWGPHGPQVGAHTTTPNPTAPTPEPSFQSWAPQPPAPAPYSGGGASSPAASGPIAAGGPASSTLGGRPFGVWLRDLAIAGGVVGALVGGARGYLLHQAPSVVGMVALRIGVAGAALGASLPPAFRAVGSVIRAALWFGIAIALWVIAIAALGRLDWLSRLR